MSHLIFLVFVYWEGVTGKFEAERFYTGEAMKRTGELLY